MEQLPDRDPLKDWGHDKACGDLISEKIESGTLITLRPHEGGRPSERLFSQVQGGGVLYCREPTTSTQTSMPEKFLPWHQPRNPSRRNYARQSQLGLFVLHSYLELM